MIWGSVSGEKHNKFQKFVTDFRGENPVSQRGGIRLSIKGVPNTSLQALTEPESGFSAKSGSKAQPTGQQTGGIGWERSQNQLPKKKGH